MVVVFFLMVLGFVVGQTVGTIITQQQFDSINFASRDFDIQIDSKQKTSDDIVVNISYLTLERRADGWEVVRDSTSLTYSLEDYYLCRLEGYTKENCVSDAKAELIRQAGLHKKRTISYLDSQKTKDYIDELTAEDFNLTGEELNNA